MIGRVIFVFCRKSPQLDGRNLSYNCTSSSTSSSSSSSWTQIPSSCCCTAVRHGAPPLHFQQQQSHILLIQPSHTYFLEQCNSILKLHGCRVLTLILLRCSPLLLLLQLCSRFGGSAEKVGFNCTVLRFRLESSQSHGFPRGDLSS